MSEKDGESKMSEPVAWRFRFSTGGRWWYSKHGPNEHSKPQLIWEPLYASSYAQGVADAAKVCKERADKHSNFGMTREREAVEAYNCEAAIRALSAPPSVTEEWVESRIDRVVMRTHGLLEGDALGKACVLEALAALGIEVTK